MNRAVAPSGRSTSGMAYSVVRPVQLMMTRGHRGPTPESRQDWEQAVAEAKRLRAEADIRREAARIAANLKTRIAGRAPGTRRASGGSRRDRGRRRSLSTERESVEKAETGVLEAELKELTKERSAYLTELVQVLEPKRDGLLGEEAGLKARVASSRDLVRAALQARRAAHARWAGGDSVRIRLVQPEGFDPRAVSALRAKRADLEPKALASLAQTARAAARDAAETARTQGRAAERDLAEYCVQWRIENPLGTGEAPASFGYAWAKRAHDEVAAHELRRYRDQALRAEGEMRRLMIEDLLTRLADKFERVRARLDALNERLSSQTFTGRPTPSRPRWTAATPPSTRWPRRWPARRRPPRRSCRGRARRRTARSPTPSRRSPR